jgi:hypothetical protein
MTIDNSEARVNGNFEGTAIANLHSRWTDNGKSGDVKWYTKVRNGDNSVVMMMDTDADWAAYDGAGVVTLASKCDIKDVVFWDVEDYFEFYPDYPDNYYFASMLNRKKDGSTSFDGFIFGRYYYSSSYG